MTDWRKIEAALERQFRNEEWAVARDEGNVVAIWGDGVGINLTALAKPLANKLGDRK